MIIKNICTSYHFFKLIFVSFNVGVRLEFDEKGVFLPSFYSLMNPAIFEFVGTR